MAKRLLARPNIVAALEGVTVLGFPRGYQRRRRTANALERGQQEIRRRTRVVGAIPSDGACLRLASAILMETAKDWQTGRAYLTMEPDTQREADTISGTQGILQTICCTAYPRLGKPPTTNPRALERLARRCLSNVCLHAFCQYSTRRHRLSIRIETRSNTARPTRRH